MENKFINRFNNINKDEFAMNQSETNNSCPPSHKDQPLSGHCFIVTGYNNWPNHQKLKDEFELKCTQCDFQTTSEKPLRKIISITDESHVHDWHTVRFPLKSPYAFCYYCNATKACNEKLDADACGKECDRCGPSEFKFTQTYLTYPIQRLYQCQKCNAKAVRFTWHPKDFPSLSNSGEWIIVPGKNIYPVPKEDIAKQMSISMRFDGKLCDGCGKFEGEARSVSTDDYIVSIHDEDPKTSLRYIKKNVSLLGIETSMYFDYCPDCIEKEGLIGYKILIATPEAYDDNDDIVSSITKLRFRNRSEE